LQINLDCPLGQAHLVRDFLVGSGLSDVLQDLALASRKLHQDDRRVLVRVTNGFHVGENY
jgi:hypothetical protein